MTKYFKYFTVVLVLVFLSGCATVKSDNGGTNVPTETITYASEADKGSAFETPSPFYIFEAVKGKHLAANIPQPASRPEKGRVLGSFTTEFTIKPVARAHNISLAVGSINNFVIKSGEEFSFNRAVGPTTKENGYKEAKIFIRGKEEKGYGGGVCQVSSTLFNACDFAGLEILERHDHSKEVTYVKPGRDAATSDGGIDFRFVNNKDYPVKICAEVKSGKVTVKVLAA